MKNQYASRFPFYIYSTSFISNIPFFLKNIILNMNLQSYASSSNAFLYILIMLLTINKITKTTMALSNTFLIQTNHDFVLRNTKSHHSSQYLHQLFEQQRTLCKSRSTYQLKMGLQITIRIVGKKQNGSEKWLEEAYSIYDKRLRPSNINVETIWHRNNDELIKGIQSDIDKRHSVILLDPLGKHYTSEEFSTKMFKWLEVGGSRLSFVIGGADGLPPELKPSSTSSNYDNNTYNLISLSKLTFTHQFARTLLMEQIYRASEINRGSSYHK